MFVFVRRRLAWYLLFLLGFLVSILVNTRGLALDLGFENPVLVSQSVPIGKSLQQADNLYRYGNFNEAINLWEAALAQISIPQERAVVYGNLASAFRQIGQIDRAIGYWEEAIEIYKRIGDRQARLQSAKLSIEQAQAYSELGQHKRAIQLLQTAIKIAQDYQDRLTELAANGAFGNAYFALADYEKSLLYQQKSLQIARDLESNNKSDFFVKSSIQNVLNNLGNVYAKRSERYRYQATVAELEGDEKEKDRLLDLARKDTNSGLEAFQQSIQTAATDVGTVQALLNLNRLLEKVDPVNSSDKIDSSAIAKNRSQALELLAKMPDSRDKAYALINVAQDAESQAAVKILADAIAVAKNIGDTRAESFALGSLAQLYETAHQYNEAMELNRQAQFAAQKVNAIDSLYRWEWQAGRISRATGELNKALAYYEQAIASLQSIRSDILAANKDFQFDFRDSVEPVYRQTIELILAKHEIITKQSNAPIINESQEDLSRVLDILELLKLAELQNFFGDECVQIAKDETQKNGYISNKDTAIIYSVVLSQGTEMILQFSDGRLKGYQIPIEPNQLQKEIDSLRLLLENRATDEYITKATEVYDLLIRPMEKDLAAVNAKTIVFINDGVLRKVPMSALFDGEKFLIQKYAIATTPSLNLTASKPIDRNNLRALSVGLTVERPPFAPLLNVANEVAEVQSILGGTKLLDKDFTLDRLKTELRQNNFSIVHMATHGKFGVDAASTFLLGYDARISIDQIDRLLRIAQKSGGTANNKQTVELLTLSACQTAAGDNRSALGIAGVAVRAGVKSALASLWFINDEATVPLIEEFYSQLRQPNMTKAEALQKAQLKLIESEDYSHPAVWSPFILIGNWL